MKRLVTVWCIVVAAVLVVTALGQIDPMRVGPTGALNPAGGPATPPATVTAFFGFTSVDFDTVTDGNDVELTVRGYAQGADGLANWQWRQHHDDAWATLDDQWWSDGEGDDSTYARALVDTIHTEVAKADLDSVHIRMRGKFTADSETATWLYTGPVYMAIDPGDTTAPAAPTNLLASGGFGFVSLDWDDNAGGDGVDHYNVYRARTVNITPPGSYSLYTPTVDATSSFTDPYATSGDTLYWYYVTALDASSNESSASNVSIAGPDTDDPPAAPTGLYAESGDQLVSLEWESHPDPDGDLKYYKLYRQYETDGPFDAIPVSLFEPGYLDQGVGLAGGVLVNGTQYGYYVTAIDLIDQESATSDTVYATPAEAGYVAIEILNASLADGYIDASGDSLTVELDIELSKDAWVKCESWYYGNNSGATDASGVAPTDTSIAEPYNTWHPLATTGSVVFDTRIPSISATADSTILLDWRYGDLSAEQDASAPDSLILERQHNGGSWEYVCVLPGTATSFRHQAAAEDTAVSVRRGIEWYRIWAFKVDPVNGGNRSNYIKRTPPYPDYSYLDSDLSTLAKDPYYNQARRVFFQVDAYDGVNAASTTVPVNVIFSPPPAVDETAPTVAFRFDLLPDGIALFDTNFASNVILNLRAQASEGAISQWQWASDEPSPGPGIYTPGDSTTRAWVNLYSPARDSTYTLSQRDTIHTGYNRGAADEGGTGFAQLDSTYIRVRSKDATGNVSAWAYLDTALTRKPLATPGTWDGIIIVSNSSEAPGIPTADTTQINDEVYAAALDMSCSNPNCWDTYNSYDTDWGAVAAADAHPYPAMGSRYARSFGSYPGGLRFTQGDGARIYPFFSFGPTDELVGATINSATLYLKTATTNYPNAFNGMDSVYVYSCALDTTLHQWLDAPNPNDNISYMYSNVASSVAWLKEPATEWDATYSANGPNSMFGLHKSFAPADLYSSPTGEDEWIEFDVTYLVEEQLANEAPMMFYMCFNSSSDYNYTAFHNMGNDNGNGGSAVANRPYLKLDVTAQEDADTTPPALVGDIAAAFYDSTDTDNVILEVSAVTGEAALAWWQWNPAYNGTWTPATPVWTGEDFALPDTAFATALADTIHTLYDTDQVGDQGGAGFAHLDSFWVRVKFKDATQNVSDWYEARDKDLGEQAFPFVRADGIDPDTTVITLAFDNAKTDNVKFTLTGTATEPVQVWNEIKIDDGAWLVDTSWEPIPLIATESISDYRWTGTSIDDLDGSTVYSRFQLKDLSGNTTGWYEPTGRIYEMPSDTDPPDTQNVFVSAVQDSALVGSDQIVFINLAIDHPTEAVQVWQQMKMGAGGNWFPTSPTWEPAVATINQHTTNNSTDLTTDDLTGVSMFTRWKIRDVSLNESAWQPWGEDPDIQIDFVRAEEASANWSGHVFVMNAEYITDTHPNERDDVLYGQVDTLYGASPEPYTLVNRPTYAAGINMWADNHTVTSVKWGSASGSDPETNALPMSTKYGRTNLGGWHVTSGGASSRSYPLFNFGDTDSLVGATVDSAKFWIRCDTKAFYLQSGVIDSLFLYSCATSDVMSEWANDNDDASYSQADESGDTDWTTGVPSWDRVTHGGLEVARVQLKATSDWGASVDYGAYEMWHPAPAVDTFIFFNVTDLVQEQIDASREMTFFMTHRDDSANALYIESSFSGNDDSDMSNRFYLELWISE